MVRLAYHERVSGYVGGRTALLCACAMAALAAQPAFAGPVTITPPDAVGLSRQGELASSSARGGDDVPSAALGGRNFQARMPGSGIELNGSSAPRLTASGGTFDVRSRLRPQ